MAGNPIYNMAPTVPPGLEGLPYTVGPIVAGMTGGVASPYVPPNMGTADAIVASQVNNPLYKNMMAQMYGQLGAQIGNTAGAMQFVQGIGTMAGYSPAETQKALSGGMGAFARSQLGSFLMPALDSGLNAMGLTGGSFIAASQEAYSKRMNLMGAGMLANPYDAGQQHRAVAAATATATLLNNVISQRDGADNLLASTNQAVTQGFSRERVMQMAMQAAGRGMFTAKAEKGFDDVESTGIGSISERLTQAVDNNMMDLSRLDVKNFDNKSGGALSQGRATERLERLKNEFKRNVQGLTEAMGAMRDLTGFVDERLEAMLDDVTNGQWNRSAKSAFAARNAVRTLQAASQAYNVDPHQALAQIGINRLTLQNAAGFDDNMRALGFDGGGMFGLGAQTELFANIEDMINAKGARGDPRAEARLRRQGLQAMSRNMNATAGKAAQILAYALQTGVISEDQASGFASLLTSGDNAMMGDGLNRLLTTVFGSAEAGRRFMNDSMQMNSMRMAMNDSAGKYATMLTMSGTDAEFHRREQVSAASQRLAFTQQALSESGMNTWQSADGANKVIANIVATIRGDGKDQTRVDDANAFQSQFDAMVAKGMDPRTAASAIVSAYKRSPVTSHYAQDIDLAIKQQAAVNNEEALKAGGLESRQATALLRALTARGSIDGRESANFHKMIRDGKGAEALAQMDSVIGRLDASTQRQLGRVKADAAKKHEAALATMEDNQEVTELIGLVSGRGYSGEDVAKAYETMAAAGMRYAKSGKSGDDYNDFWDDVSKTNFVGMFGKKALKEYMDAVQSGDTDYLSKMGRRAGALRRTAVANLKDSGYDLGMSGYWGGGASAVNSEEARKHRDSVINNIASKVSESALLDADDRKQFAAGVTDFLMGTKDWKSLLKVYDPKDKTGLRSTLKEYGAAFRKYQSAQETFNDRYGKYRDAIGLLGQEKAYNEISDVEELFRSGDEIHIDTLKEMLGRVSNKDAVADIIAAAEARNEVISTQRESEEILGNTVADERKRKELEGLVAWDKVRKQRKAKAAKIAKDEKVSAFLEDFDFSAEGMRDAKGASKAFLDKMFAAVTDEEVAAKVGVDASKGVKHKFGEAAMAIVREKAAKGDEQAISALKAARAAQRAEATRIHGEITIKRGNDSEPAVLDANVGGLS